MTLCIEALFSQSINGALALRPNESNAKRHQAGLTSDEDACYVRQTCDTYDAIITSYQTMKLEKGLIRHSQGKIIPWFVFTSPENRELVRTCPVWKQQGVFVCSVSLQNWAKQAHSNELCSFESHQHFVCSSLGDLLEYFRKNNYLRVGLLAGPSLISKFLSLDLIDVLNVAMHPLVSHSNAYTWSAFSDQESNFLLDEYQIKNSIIFLKYKKIKQNSF